MKLTRRQTLKMTAAFAAGSALPVLTRPAIAATSWDFADEYTLDVVSNAARLFVEEVSKRSNGDLQINYKPGGVLGFKSADHLDAVEDGLVQMAVTLITQQGGVDPFFNMTSLPFLAKNLDESYALWKLSRVYYEESLAKLNQKALWTAPSAPAGVWSRKPLESAASIKNLRIRSFDANSTRTLANAGAAPLQLAWGDLIPQLSTGGIDAVITSVDGGRQLTIWDHTPYFTALNYSMALYVTHCNLDAYNALSDGTKAAIEEANALAEAKAWDGMRESIVASYKLLSAAGGTAIEPAPADIVALLQESAKPIYAEWVAKTGERGQKILAELGKSI